MNKFIIIIIIILIYPSAGSCLSDLSLAITKSDKGKTLTFDISATGDSSGCTLTVRAATIASKLNQGKGVLLVTKDISTLPISLQAIDLTPIQSFDGASKVKIFFAAKTVCANQILSSNIVNTFIKENKDESSPSLKKWFEILGEGLSIDLSIEEAFPNLSFSRITDIQFAPDGTNRAFVVEQTGKIYSFLNDSSSSSKINFLDLTGKISSGIEPGVLGLAFDPSFSTNREFFVHYINLAGDSIIAKYQQDQSDSTIADPNSEVILLTIPKANTFHHGGQLVFGPDGFLYASVGDGGPQGDPLNRGQGRKELLGSLLRIDVHNPDSGLNYGIPSSNPFVNNTKGYKEEIFAYGFRNPWRFSFDSSTSDIWLADVGLGLSEEVNIIKSGKNYGWNVFEGSTCRLLEKCTAAKFINPIYSYDHNQGKAITGGFVYRGSSFNSLSGRYVYGDFASGKIWALKKTGGNVVVSTLINSTLFISTFGQDRNGEILIGDYGGTIYKFKED